jgi:very-short-patch-repair endonuclease
MYRNREQREFARQLRNDATPAETRLWYLLRSGQLGVKFRRQAAIGAYIVDFVCFSHRLIVELDGPQHQEEQGKAHDGSRTAWLAAQGFRLIRFPNQTLDEDIGQVVEEIKQGLECRSVPLPSPPRKGEGAGRLNTTLRLSSLVARTSDGQGAGRLNCSDRRDPRPVLFPSLPRRPFRRPAIMDRT